MAGAGYLLFVAGQKLTAAQVNTYLMQQSVPQFADASARNTALSAVLDEGLLSTQADSNSITQYSGAAWSTLGPTYGAGTAWTPTVTQSGSVAVTVTAASYFRWGRMVTARFKVVCTGTGTAANAIVIGGLPVAGLTTVGASGGGFVYDASGPNRYQGMVALASSTTFVLYSPGSVAAEPTLGTTSFTAALTTNDEIHATFTYEAAGDA